MLFAASEAGSVRALVPVALSCHKAGVPLLLVRRGHMGHEAGTQQLPFAPCPQDESEMTELLTASAARALVFSSNIKDSLPLRLARVAQQAGLPTIHVLDYWGNSLHRMTLDGGPPFRPDCYAVPDELALRMAMQDGIDPQTVAATGQPAFGDTLETFSAGVARAGEWLRSSGLSPQGPLVLFVSEPVAQDQGSALDSPGYRGYDEQLVLSGLVQTLKGLPTPPQVLVLAHPRTQVEELAALWRHLGGEQFGPVAAPAWGRGLLPLACGVVGMASTLLYEAWLLGLPVASLQPGVRQEHLRMLKHREGVLFVEDQAAFLPSLSRWLGDLGQGEILPRPELALHAKSAETILNIAQQLQASGGVQSLAGRASRRTA